MGLMLEALLLGFSGPCGHFWNKCSLRQGNRVLALIVTVIPYRGGSCQWVECAALCCAESFFAEHCTVWGERGMLVTL